MNPHDYKILYYDTSLVCDGICLYWLKEIHINKNWQNTPMAMYIVNHELKHAEFAENILLAHNQFRRFILIIKNNIWDYFSTWKLLFLKLKYSKDLVASIKEVN